MLSITTMYKTETPALPRRAPFPATLLAATALAFGALAADTSETPNAKSYIAEVQALIVAKDHDGAMEILGGVMRNNPNDADARNLAGFASRQLGEFGDAAVFYAQALEIDPRHVGALEYQGELYLLIDRPQKAEANLERLLSICGRTCEEYIDLADGLAAYRAAHPQKL